MTKFMKLIKNDSVWFVRIRPFEDHIQFLPIGIPLGPRIPTEKNKHQHFVYKFNPPAPLGASGCGAMIPGLLPTEITVLLLYC